MVGEQRRRSFINGMFFQRVPATEGSLSARVFDQSGPQPVSFAVRCSISFLNEVESGLPEGRINAPRVSMKYRSGFLSQYFFVHLPVGILIRGRKHAAPAGRGGGLDPEYRCIRGMLTDPAGRDR